MNFRHELTSSIWAIVLIPTVIGTKLTATLVAEKATLVALSRVLLNLDEFVTRD